MLDNRFLHRFWLLFTVAFSSYLRLEINTNILRRDFYDQRKCPTNPNSSFHYYFQNDSYGRDRFGEESKSCVGILNGEGQGENLELFKNLKINNRPDAARILEDKNIKLCHPNNNHIVEDSSRIVFLTMTGLASSSFLFTFGQLILIFCKVNKDPAKVKEVFKKSVTMFQLALALIMMAVSCGSDSQNLKPNPARPFIDFDDGFEFIEMVVCVLALSILLYGLDQMITLGQHKSMLGVAEAIFSLNFIVPISATVSVIRKNYLTDGGDVVGLAAIGITLAWLGIILKIGQYNFSTLGNFATMFHIVLKKLRVYMIAVFILLFGFSFGFWIIMQHEDMLGSHFKNFSGSIFACFIMFFGEFGNYGEVLDYEHEIKKGHVLTFTAFYVLFLMMIIMSSLGMLNLLMAAIIMDYRKALHEVHTQNLVFMAQYVLVVDRGLLAKLIPKR